MSINVATVVELTAQLRGARYQYGAKWPLRMLTDADVDDGVDCSGFTRWVIHQASDGLTIPGGSVTQHERFAALATARGLETPETGVPYATVEDAPGVLFAAGFAGTAENPIGHVWLVVDGVTCESRGGVGVDRRPWNTRGLRATWCYPLAVRASGARELLTAAAALGGLVVAARLL